MGSQQTTEGGLDARPRDARLARLRATAPRHLATAAMLVLLALGLRALFIGPEPPPAPRPPLRADLPSRDFALQFARGYLGYDAARPERRARALAPFVGGMETGAGFTAPSGERRVRWVQVASDQPALAGGRLITVAAGVSGRAAPIYLAVPVRHRPGRGVSLAGYPALVGAPAIEPSVAAPPTASLEHPEVAAVVERVLRNYLSLSANNLEADLGEEAVVTLPTERLRLQGVRDIAWFGAPRSGAVLATVVAADAGGATYTLAYEIGIELRERPYVDFIEVIPTRG